MAINYRFLVPHIKGNKESDKESVTVELNTQLFGWGILTTQLFGIVLTLWSLKSTKNQTQNQNINHPNYFEDLEIPYTQNWTKNR